MLLASNSFQNNTHNKGVYHKKNFLNQNNSFRQVNHTPMGYQRVQRVDRRIYQAPQFYQRVRPRVQNRRPPQVPPRVQHQRQRPMPNRFEPRKLNRSNPRSKMNQNNRFAKAQEAAKRGHPQAEFDLAMMYAKGEGVQKNPRTAFNLFHRAARKGHVEAKYCMAVNFDKGFGVIKQQELARHWYNIAAKAGHRGAQQRLAQLNTQHSPNRGLIRNASYRRQ
jgi:hypothetical protein